MVSVVVCTDLSGKEPHRLVGVGRVVTSGSLGGVMVGVIVCTDIIVSIKRLTIPRG